MKKKKIFTSIFLVVAMISNTSLCTIAADDVIVEDESFYSMSSSDSVEETTESEETESVTNELSVESIEAVSLSDEDVLCITSQPVDVIVEDGVIVSFSVEASGSELSYQWQYSRDNGEKWLTSNASGSKTSTITLTATQSKDGYLYRCLVSDSNNNCIITNSAKLAIGLLVIDSQPTNITIESGNTALFSVAATGEGLTYQWQYSVDSGETWLKSNGTGSTTDTLKITAISSRNGYMYRCVITNSAGNSLTSNGAKLSVGTFEIVTQPKNVTVASGKTATFTVEAEGEGLTYQWQYSANSGVTWVKSSGSGNATDTIKITSASSRDGYMYRCVVTDSNGSSLTSEGAKLSVGTFEIVTQPLDCIAVIGTRISFSVEANGSSISYQWQYSKDAGNTWLNSSATGNKTNTISFTASSANDNYMYRCVLTDEYESKLVSNSATLTSVSFVITKQPESLAAESGEIVSLAVEAEGTGLTYQWQYSKNSGRSWVTSNGSGNKTDNLTFTMTSSKNGYMYRCVITNEDDVALITDEVTVTLQTIKITQQPVDWSGSEGSKFYFYVDAEGENLSYQWQYSTDDGNSWKTSTITTAIYSSTISTSRDGWLFRCIVSNEEGEEVYSDIVELTISTEFAIISHPTEYIGDLGDASYLYIQVGGIEVSYQWQKSTDGKNDWEDITSNSTALTSRLGQTIMPSKIGYYYRCVVTNSNGDTLTSAPAQILASESGFITYNDNIYYICDNGKVAAGLVCIDDKIYYFAQSGTMLYGYKVIDDNVYYFTEDGSASTGWTYIESQYATYYFDEDGSAHTGWLELDNESYYFYSNGVLARGLAKIGGKCYYFDLESGAQLTGLITVGTNNYMYFSADDGVAQTGLMNINGALYYFSTESSSYGVALGGLQTIDGQKYYFDSETKKAVSGFVTIDDNIYYFGANFTAVTGLQWIEGDLYYFSSYGSMYTGFRQIDGIAYCFSDDGKAISGWYTTDAGSTFYFDEDSFAGLTGIQEIDGSVYYFDTNGRMCTGLYTIDGENYYFGENGTSEEGFVTVSGKTFYVDSQCKRLTGLQTINGNLYYFSSFGTMTAGMRTINGIRYMFDSETGMAVTGFVIHSNGYTYYFDGVNGGLTGLQEINGKLYYLSDKNIVQYGSVKLDGAFYYFDRESGEAVTGWWNYITTSGKAYKRYYDPDTYQAVSGLQTIDGTLYYFDSSYCYMQTGSKTIDGVTYYFDKATGAAYSGTVSSNAYTWLVSDGNTYYLDASGNPVTGLRSIESAVYYFDEDGVLVLGWVTVDEKTYYFTESGALTGEQEIDGNKYYFGTQDAALISGIFVISGTVYYFDSDGISTSGWIQTTSGSVLYLSEDNEILTGLQVIDGNTYWFGTNGVRTSGIQTVEDSSGNQYVCYFDEDGIMQTGLIEYLGHIYYFDETTGAQQTGFVSVNGNEYYFDSSTGRAAIGLKSIDGFYYFFDSNGIRQLGLQWYKTHLYCLSDNSEDGLTYGLAEVDDSVYYFNESGIALTGYRTVDDIKYYFDNDTCASIGGIIWINSSTAYAFIEGGGYETGFVEEDGNVYYFNLHSGAMVFGLYSSGDTLYYFDSDGIMLTNTSVEVAGVTYAIDENGSVTASGDSDLAALINSGINKLGTPYGSDYEGNDYYVGEGYEGDYYSCSGFVAAALADAGISVTTSVYRQCYALLNGDYEIEIIDDLSEALPGDLIYESRSNCDYGDDCEFWNEIHHVRIYLGNGKTLESTPSTGETSGVMVHDYTESSSYFIYVIIRIKSLNS